MSHYLDLSDEDRIKLARDAVQCKVPIPPVIVAWLHEVGLHDQVVNPRKTDASTKDHEGEHSDP